jgi:hypothetical protein
MSADQSDKLTELEALYVQKKAIESQIQAHYQASLAAPESEKLVPDWEAEVLSKPPRYIEYPITVLGITSSTDSCPVKPHWTCEIGSFVQVRPCDKELDGKTFLGIALGDISRGATARFNASTGILELSSASHNPAMWVPALKRVIWGDSSWWGPIETEEQLRQITDTDIQNVWYVRALQQLHPKKKEEASDAKS